MLILCWNSFRYLYGGVNVICGLFEASTSSCAAKRQWRDLFYVSSYRILALQSNKGEVRVNHWVTRDTREVDVTETRNAIQTKVDQHFATVSQRHGFKPSTSYRPTIRDKLWPHSPNCGSNDPIFVQYWPTVWNGCPILDQYWVHHFF